MIDVEQIDLGVPCVTRLWASKDAAESIEGFYGSHTDDPPDKFWKKIKRFAENGFFLAERAGVVRHEWGGVYRVGFVDSLYRLIGFYEDASKHDFIIFDAFKKHGQKLTKSERRRINTVVEIKKLIDWRKVV